MNLDGITQTDGLFSLKKGFDAISKFYFAFLPRFKPSIEKYNNRFEEMERESRFVGESKSRKKRGIDRVRRQARRVVTLSCLDRG